MKNKKSFIAALSTLFFSWGSDTPAEVVWGANDLLNWYESEFNVNLNIRFLEEDGGGCSNYKEVINEINKN